MSDNATPAKVRLTDGLGPPLEDALAAIEGATVAQVAVQFELSSDRVRQCIDRVFRMSKHPSRWDATGGAEHPHTLRAARMQPEPLVSVLRQMLQEA